MLVQMYYPNILSPTKLDQYLAQGWFRSSSMLFATKLICLEADVHSVVNIRIELDSFTLKKRQRKLLTRNHKQFRMVLGRPSMTAEKEQLYAAHKKRFKGFILESLEMYLYANDRRNNIFDSYEICVYDGDKLISLSYFDLGVNSLASILGLYDEDYKKFSLGTFTMLLEVQFAISRGLKYYYPGYILDGNDSFDYKLKLGEFQFYDWSGKWHLMGVYEQKNLSARILKQKLKEMKAALRRNDIKFEQFIYPYFFSGYLDFYQTDLFRSPIMISVFPDLFGDDHLAIEYSIESQAFKLAYLTTNTKMRDLFFDSPFTNEAQNSDYYANNVYQYEEIFLNVNDPEVLANRIAEIGYFGWKNYSPSTLT